ncbi:hypothetical protein SUGI_1031880 [Cryptomeria japonica]|nr:hypothetical protein SUGI_1031880 [Cryptomeria japonica]
MCTIERESGGSERKTRASDGDGIAEDGDSDADEDETARGFCPGLASLLWLASVYALSTRVCVATGGFGDFFSAALCEYLIKRSIRVYSARLPLELLAVSANKFSKYLFVVIPLSSGAAFLVLRNDGVGVRLS